MLWLRSNGTEDPICNNNDNKLRKINGNGENGDICLSISHLVYFNDHEINNIKYLFGRLRLWSMNGKKF